MVHISPREPEVFYKDAFCKAVTGYTDSELRDMVSKGVVNPVDEKINLSVGRDMPRSQADETIDRFAVFMSMSLSIPLINKPIEELYTDFRKFRSWEEHVHPRQTFTAHAAYWGPTYREIEEAHRNGDGEGIKQGIITLVDQILHD